MVWKVGVVGRNRSNNSGEASVIVCVRRMHAVEASLFDAASRFNSCVKVLYHLSCLDSAFLLLHGPSIADHSLFCLLFFFVLCSKACSTAVEVCWRASTAAVCKAGETWPNGFSNRLYRFVCLPNPRSQTGGEEAEKRAMNKRRQRMVVQRQ